MCNRAHYKRRFQSSLEIELAGVYGPFLLQGSMISHLQSHMGTKPQVPRLILSSSHFMKDGDLINLLCQPSLIDNGCMEH